MTTKSTEPKENNDYDTCWKNVMEPLALDFIKLFYPKIYGKMDLTKKIDFLDKELQNLNRVGKKGRKNCDKLVRVYLKDGRNIFVLIHIEVQSRYDLTLNEKMYKSYYRLREKYPKAKVTSIVIYTNNEVPANYNRYEEGEFGDELSFKFNTYILKKHSEEELMAGDNPMEVVLLAHKYALRTEKDMESRYHLKNKIIELATLRNYSKKQIEALLTFNEFMLTLTDEVIELHKEESADFLKNTIDMQLSPSKMLLMQEIYAKAFNTPTPEEFKVERQQLIAAERKKAAVEREKAVAAERRKAAAERQKAAAERRKVIAAERREVIKAERQKAETERQKAITAERKKAEAERQKAAAERQAVIEEAGKLGLSNEQIAKLVNLPIEKVLEIKAKPK